jgi:hypothetical protein
MNAGKPFKLLMGITLSEMGGAQKVVYDLISSLPRSVYNITLITYPVEIIAPCKLVKYNNTSYSSLRKYFSPWVLKISGIDTPANSSILLSESQKSRDNLFASACPIVDLPAPINPTRIILGALEATGIMPRVVADYFNCFHKSHGYIHFQLLL